MPIDTSSLPTERQARRAWLKEREEELAALTKRHLRAILVGAYERFLNSLTAAGDLTSLDGIPNEWISVVYDDIAPKVEELYLAGNVTAWLGMPTDPNEGLARQWEAVTNENAVSYMAGATNRLAGVGENAWSMVRAKTTEGLAAGMTSTELRGQIESITKFSEFRADTIARTETNAAYVQGDMAGARALGSAGPALKVWRATFDSRTRDDHAEAEGQTVPLDQPFTVGGESMDAPLDPTASAGNVVNCRCYVEFLYPGDITPDGDTVEAPVLAVPESPQIQERAAEPGVATAMQQGRAARFERMDDAAARHGVSREQLAASWNDTKVVVAGIKQEAAQSAADSFAHLDRFEGLKLARPPKGARGAEYDFLERLSPSEKSRLSAWWSDAPSSKIDVVLDRAITSGAFAPDTSIDEFVQDWLHHTRVIDSSASLRSGRLPTSARFGGFDPVELAPKAALEGIDIEKMIGKDVWDQAGYLASQQLEAVTEDAYRALGAAVDAETPVWRMSFNTWRDAVGDAEYSITNGVDVAAAQARLNELIPFDLDHGQDYEELYAAIVEVAKVAKVDVAEWAVIPWAAG